MRRVSYAAGPALVFALGCGLGKSEVPSSEPGPVTAPSVAPVVDVAPVTATAAPAEPDDGLIDAAAAFNGSRVIGKDGTVDVNHANDLFSRTPSREWVCSTSEWCDVVVELSEPYDLQAVGVRIAESPEVRPSHLEISTGPAWDGPWAPYTEVSLTDSQSLQRFPAMASGVRFARIRFSGWSAGEFVGLDEIQLRGTRSATRPTDWNGEWVTDTNSTLTLEQDGTRVTGCYAAYRLVYGEVDGPVFTGIMEGDVQEDGTIARDPVVWALTPEHGLRGVWADHQLPRELVNRIDAEPSEGDIDHEACRPPERLGMGAELAKTGRITLYGVTFDFDKDTLRPGSEKALEELAVAILAAPDESYRIEGHTDSVGGEAYNLDLSDRRAKTVVAWLVARGCPEGSLQAQGYGMGSPVAPNDTAAGRSMNRRVEVALTEG